MKIAPFESADADGKLISTPTASPLTTGDHNGAASSTEGLAYVSAEKSAEMSYGWTGGKRWSGLAGLKNRISAPGGKAARRAIRNARAPGDDTLKALMAVPWL